MIVYHGSNIEVIKIDLLKSKKGLDFGKGFYVTDIREQAEIWARKRSIKEGGDAVVSGFEFKHENVFLNSYYKTKSFEGYTNNWLDFIIENRNNDTDSNLHNYDVVEGPLADDEVVVRVKDFMNGKISREDLLEELKFKHVTHQICFCTKKSLDSIVRVNLKPLSNIEHIGISVMSYLVANDNLSLIDAQNLYYESETYKKVSDENSSLHLKPWQEIYGMLKREMEKTQTKEKDIDGLSL